MNLDLFTFEKNDSITNESNGTAIIGKSAFKKKIKSSNRNDAFAEIINSVGGLPKNNEIVRIKTTGASDTGSIFNYIQANCEKITEFYLSTWIISRDNIEMLCKLVDSGKIEKITFVVSKRLKELKKSNYAFLVEQFDKRNTQIQYRVCNCHAKTFSLTDGTNYFTVDGSGNWTENPRIENYCIVNDKDSFLFNKQWMEELM